MGGENSGGPGAKRLDLRGGQRRNGDAYNLGLGAPEDLRLIPSGQNLYCLDFTFNQLLKVAAGYFGVFVGDILVVDEGRGCAVAGLYIVHWEGGRFVVRQIPIATSELEHVTFAPIDIQALP